MQLLFDDERPFVFSTPRLNEPNKLKLNIPFHDKVMDELFKMQRTPQQLAYIADLFGQKYAGAIHGRAPNRDLLAERCAI